MHTRRSDTHATAMSDLDLEFLFRGRQPHPATMGYARKKILAAARTAPAPVRFGRVTLTLEGHRSIERPSRIEVMLDVDGRIVRAQATARSTEEAIDLVDQRLRRLLRDTRQRIEFLRKGGRHPDGARGEEHGSGRKP